MCALCFFMFGWLTLTWGLLQILFTWGAAVRCKVSIRSVSPKGWTHLFALFLLYRIGEAANPGPTLKNDFVLGVINPSGLSGKAPYIVSQLPHGDLWSISETHLCTAALKTFRSSLQFAEGPFRYCVGGHPVPAQTSRTFHHAWRGVAVLSVCPLLSGLFAVRMFAGAHLVQGCKL